MVRTVRSASSAFHLVAQPYLGASILPSWGT